MSADKSNTRKGVLIALTGGIIIIPDTVIIKYVSGDSAPVIFWKSLSMMTIILAIVIWRQRGNIIPFYIRLGLPGVMMGLLYAFSSICFNSAMKYTTAANVLVTLSCGPVITALLSRLILKEQFSKSTLIALIFCISGILIFFIDTLGSVQIFGILLAIGATVSISLEFILVRRYKQINLFPCMVYSGLIMCSIFWFYKGDYSTPSEIMLMAIAGLVMTASFYLLFKASKYIPATWSNMVMLLETVCAPVLVWLLLGETLSLLSFIGASLVIITLSVFFFFQLKNTRAA